MKIYEANVLLVFTRNQQEKYQNRIKRFKNQMEKINITLNDFHLGKKFENGIKNEFQRVKFQFLF